MKTRKKMTQNMNKKKKNDMKKTSKLKNDKTSKCQYSSFTNRYII